MTTITVDTALAAGPPLGLHPFARSVVVHNGYTFVAYVASGGVVTLKQYDAAGSLVNSVAVETVDTHGYPTLALDPTDGNLVMLYAPGSSMKIRKTTTPDNLATLSAASTLANQPGFMNYPCATFFSTGTLVMLNQKSTAPMYLMRSAGGGSRTAAQIAASAVWTQALTAWGTDGSNCGSYPATPVVTTAGGTEKMGIAFSTTGPNFGSGIQSSWGCGYLQSTDDGATWKRVDGTTPSLPLLYSSSTVRSDTALHPCTTYCNYNLALAFDGSGNPIVTYCPGTASTTKAVVMDTLGVTVARWTGGAWLTSALLAPTAVTGDYDWPYAKMVRVGSAFLLYSNRRTADDGGYPMRRIVVDSTTDLSSWTTAVFAPTSASGTSQEYVAQVGVSGSATSVAWARDLTLMLDIASSAPLTVVSGPFVLTGTSLTVTAPVGTQTTSVCSVYSAAGGSVQLAGSDSARFGLSLDGASWTPSVIVGPGTTSVQIGVTPVAGDTSLTTRLRIPA